MHKTPHLIDVQIVSDLLINVAILANVLLYFCSITTCPLPLDNTENLNEFKITKDTLYIDLDIFTSQCRYNVKTNLFICWTDRLKLTNTDHRGSEETNIGKFVFYFIFGDRNFEIKKAKHTFLLF